MNQVWPILKPVLEYAELVKITGPGAGNVINKFVEIGDWITNEDIK